MKIAQIVSLEESVPPQSKNGLEFVVSWLTEELVKRGHKVTLFAPANSKTKAKLVSIFPHGTVEIKKMVWGWRKGVFSEWNTAKAMSKQKEFDIIHTHTGTIFQFAPFINKPIIYTTHGPCSDGFRKKYLSQKKYQKYFKFALEQYRKINYVNISQHQQNDFLKCKKYYFKKHTTIHNGIPVEKFQFNNNPENYLFYLGYINQDKGADIAVRIAKKLKMKLILAGGVYGQEKFFKEKIKPYLNKNIKYIGPVNFQEKVKLLKNATALLNPVAWHEPFGLVPVEAQACGTPVVAFNKGAMLEIIKHNKTGFVVENEKEMIDVVKNINKINRKDCREWVEKNFSVEKMVDEYEKLYKKLIKK